MRTLIIGLLAATLISSAPAQSQTVRVTESDGIVVPIGQDVASVLIANPDIANVQPLSDRSLFLYGKSVGATRLFVMDADDRIILERRIVVTQSLQTLQGLTRSSLSN